MSNWAKLQEDLVGLPVAKRAKHGIHFQKGANEFVANFSGKPCHHFADGIWKPIDTRLLVTPDGFYGCPHSPVRVHTDGHVKVEGTDYQQYTKLPSATGLVDNDRIVREFSFGKQEMRITENGYRSEITLNRIPTLQEARKLIASESGTLSKEYLKSLTTATDANGDTHTFTTLTAFRTWLASAVFPVVIDPDFSTTSTAGDTLINNTTSKEVRNYGAQTISEIINPSGAHYRKLMYRFDCSSIDGASTCSAVTFKIIKASAPSSSSATTMTAYSIAIGNKDWIEGTKNDTTAAAGEPCWDALAADGSGGVTTAWAGSAGMETSGTDYEADAIGTMNINRADAQYTEYTMTFNATGIARVKNWFGATNTNYGFLAVVGANNAQYYFSEISTESYRPVLSVTYTAAATGTLRRTNMNAQMSNLTGGMHG